MVLLLLLMNRVISLKAIQTKFSYKYIPTRSDAHSYFILLSSYTGAGTGAGGAAATVAGCATAAEYKIRIVWLPLDSYISWANIIIWNDDNIPIEDDDDGNSER